MKSPITRIHRIAGRVDLVDSKMRRGRSVGAPRYLVYEFGEQPDAPALPASTRSVIRVPFRGTVQLVPGPREVPVHRHVAGDDYHLYGIVALGHDLVSGCLYPSRRILPQRDW